MPGERNSEERRVRMFALRFLPSEEVTCAFVELDDAVEALGDAKAIAGNEGAELVRAVLMLPDTDKCRPEPRGMTRERPCGCMQAPDWEGCDCRNTGDTYDVGFWDGERSAAATIADLRALLREAGEVLRGFANYAEHYPGMDFGHGEIGEYFHAGLRRSISTTWLRQAQDAYARIAALPDERSAG